MFVIGLTGGIASGKSAVAAMLRDLGAFIIDTDVLARQVVEPGEPAWREIRTRFGAAVFDASGMLDRKRLGDLVFQDADARAALDAITHPRIRKKVEEQIDRAAQSGYNMVVVDVPLLFETGWNQIADEVWVVYVPESVQRERLLSRDHAGEADALARISSQMSLEEKRRRGDVIIDNSGNVAVTAQQVRDAWLAANERFMRKKCSTHLGN